MTDGLGASPLGAAAAPGGPVTASVGARGER
jgi:hypothetical protein